MITVTPRDVYKILYHIPAHGFCKFAAINGFKQCCATGWLKLFMFGNPEADSDELGEIVGWNIGDLVTANDGHHQQYRHHLIKRRVLAYLRDCMYKTEISSPSKP